MTSAFQLDLDKVSQLIPFKNVSWQDWGSSSLCPCPGSGNGARTRPKRDTDMKAALPAVLAVGGLSVYRSADPVCVLYTLRSVSIRLSSTDVARRLMLIDVDQIATVKRSLVVVVEVDPHRAAVQLVLCLSRRLPSAGNLN